MAARGPENLVLDALVELAVRNDAWFTDLGEAVSAGLKRGALIPLHLLHRGGPARVTSLAVALGLDRTTVTRHLDELEGRGLITRSAAPEDRRSVIVSLTPKAQQSLDKAFMDGRETLRTQLATWTKEERAEFGRLLDRYVFPDYASEHASRRLASSTFGRRAVAR